MNKVRAAIGMSLLGLAYVQLILVGLFVVVAGIDILASDLGVWAAILGVIFFPIIFAGMPIYAGAVQGNWSILIVSIGGLVLFWILAGLGGLIAPGRA